LVGGKRKNIMNNKYENESGLQSACDPSLTRSEFIGMLLKRAAVAGALTIMPAVVDSFVAPPAIAATSGGQVGTSLSFQNPIA
jgi:hypothetical protein